MEEAELTEITVTLEMVRIAQLIEDLYQLPDCSTGGPLHIITDDNNITDHNLESCRQWLLDPDDEWHGRSRSPARDELGTQILDGLLVMSEVERSVVCSMHHGDRYVPPGSTRTFTYPAIVRVTDEYEDVTFVGVF